MTKQKKGPLILASNSPRRRSLLALGGWRFQVQAADVDESIIEGELAVGYVLRLAQSKAEAVAKNFNRQEVILASDTTVVDGGEILGKPEDPTQAVAMLRQLRAHTHQVHTALTVHCVSDGVQYSEVCTTDVPMRAYSDAEIAAYVASGDPLDKAGAYAIQNRDFRPVENLSGCFASVMGLPLCHLARLLRRIGMPAPAGDVAAACQADLGYACDVYALYLGSDR
jgi:septum formation protein